MGIQYLNRYLLDNCSKKSIQKIKFSGLSGKTIVVDASIYLYKYVGEDALIENIYLLVSILLYYKIVPVFVFDGKPPEEKRELIYQRKLKKQKAEKEYNEVKNSMIEHNATQNKADVEKMESLKRQFIRINSYHISITKQLLSCFGIQYYDAEGEADELCAKLLANHTVWACLSDDMDMFVYGCSRIIRQVSLLNHTCTLYDMGAILHDLKIDIRTFREIAVLSGSDYNTIEKIHLYKAFKLYDEYKKLLVGMKSETECGAFLIDDVVRRTESSEGFAEPLENRRFSDQASGAKQNYKPFYTWLQENKHIQELNVLQRAYDMFVISCDDIDITKYICVMGEQKKDELHKILEIDGFLTL